ncbi:hypothetical protein DMB66_02650 [Actinoplanes sp. ATCC 53533]|uniref:DUF2249 domain-containing protein n=1 Tax=Actinoplanes sp. ATCC 53533 TaxID=1288362 RepID=UPI000F7812D7|nr:DUF2249 domain-containing protein [Actinoplanes sp. ATCC 53533]RSM73818.1 hypothetical protein DMB66_02650 [Actinoplanes sp. ATCC 53533]
MTEHTVDVRPLRKPDKHPAVFTAFDALPVGDAVILINSHDPRHLREEFARERPRGFEWTYLESGPQAWRIQITKLVGTPLPRVLGDFTALDAAPDAAGAIWKLQMNDRDLDSNIIQLPPYGNIEPHIGPDLDVLVVVLEGSGALTTELDDFDLTGGQLVWLPRASHRSITAGPRGLRYLTVHRRRRALVIGAVTT